MIVFGNSENLEEFKKSIKSAFDRETLTSYFRKAEKSDAMMVVRLAPFLRGSMEALVVPYKFSGDDSGLRAVLKKRTVIKGSLGSINISRDALYVFSEKFEKHEGKEFLEPEPVKKKRKPFESRE